VIWSVLELPQFKEMIYDKKNFFTLIHKMLDETENFMVKRVEHITETYHKNYNNFAGDVGI
jgi:hypothetical protein